MSNFLARFSALLLPVSALAQAPNIGFAVQYGDVSDVQAFSVGVDALGNAYTCGGFSDTLSLAGMTVTSAGNRDCYIAKHDEQGNALWVRRFGDLFDQYGIKLAVDDAGNSVVLTKWLLTVMVDGITYSTNGGNDVAVLKYDAQGDLLWFTSFGGTQDDSPQDIGLDPSGNVFITGEFTSDLIVANDTIAGSSSSETFLVKLDPSGSPLWTRVTTGSGYANSHALAVDGSGNCYLTGIAFGTVSTGVNSFTTSGTGQSIFLAKFNGTGTDLWAGSIGPSNNLLAVRGLSADAVGNTYMAGSFDDQITIGGFSLIANGSLFDDGFVAKFNDSGVAQWADKLGGSSTDGVRDVAVDAAGNPHFVGTYSASFSIGNTYLGNAGGVDAYVTKLDPSGNYLWSLPVSGGGTDYVLGVAVHPNGNCYATGFFSGTTSVGGFTLSTTAFGDGLLIKIGTDLVTGVPAIGPRHTGKEIGRFNLLGQPANTEQRGMLIIRYDDGTARKVFVEAAR